MSISNRIFLIFNFLFFVSCSHYINEIEAENIFSEELETVMFIPGEMSNFTVEDCAKLITGVLNEKSDISPWSYSIEPNLVYNNISENLFIARKLHAKINVEISILDFLTFMQQSIYSGYMLRGSEIVFYGVR